MTATLPANAPTRMSGPWEGCLVHGDDECAVILPPEPRPGQFDVGQPVIYGVAQQIEYRRLLKSVDVIDRVDSPSPYLMKQLRQIGGCAIIVVPATDYGTWGHGSQERLRIIVTQYRVPLLLWSMEAAYAIDEYERRDRHEGVLETWEPEPWFNPRSRAYLPRGLTRTQRMAIDLADRELYRLGTEGDTAP
jgi:hypothetical protein